MQLIIYILTYPLIWFLSILPLRVLYFISDIIYILLYQIIGYRKTVVRQNLKLSFPEKSTEELLKIEKKSFHHFIDVFMEMIKSFSITKKEIAKRIIIENPELVNNYLNENKSIIVISSHHANWEWVPYLIDQLVDCIAYGAYTKIENKYFDKKIRSSRSKFGANFIPTNEFIALMQTNADENKIAIYASLCDQSPQLKKTYYWQDFMGIRVPIIAGPEMLSKRFDYPIVYLKTDLVKRGYYRSEIIELAKNPKEFPDYQITDMFLEVLEKQIRANPEYYFWTHNRFKHMGKEGMEKKGKEKR
jgi:KDO2-lipid IV(A) lauroyltransferase